MKLPEACLFDLDGVLLDTEPLHSKAWAAAVERFGKSLTTDQLENLRGRKRVDCIKEIIKLIGSKITKESFEKVHTPISNELMNKAKSMDGAEDLIRYCIDIRMPIAIVTSSSYNSVKLKIRHNNWLQIIKTTVYGDDIDLKQGKPAPDPFLLAAQKLQVEPIKCWAIEDSDSGVKSSSAAGCFTWKLINELNNESKSFNSESIKEITSLLVIKKRLEELKKIN